MGSLLQGVTGLGGSLANYAQGQQQQAQGMVNKVKKVTMGFLAVTHKHQMKEEDADYRAERQAEHEGYQAQQAEKYREQYGGAGQGGGAEDDEDDTARADANHIE